MIFCSDCGTTLISKIPDLDDRSRFCCPSCGRIHYQNPINVVGVLPVWEEKIFLCKRNIEPMYGMWTLPAGFMENGETVLEGALREAQEEAGISVQIRSLLSVYSNGFGNQVHLIFLADMISPDYVMGHETSDVKFVSPSEIVWDEIGFKSVAFALHSYILDPTRVHVGP